ncbi:Protein of unknown function [Pyronema omphalodes CBS 100304]|uniref:Uncharacterized protein n=1 Tax=Pyronema omphalodes (strain CBS 100304) TaxID=1076935 RepID=U4L396_PYROM|nr:Protein of unknown function [Pyronema omphalodes CBS 100304]
MIKYLQLCNFAPSSFGTSGVSAGMYTPRVNCTLVGCGTTCGTTLASFS